MTTSKAKNPNRRYQSVVFHCDHPGCEAQEDSMYKTWEYALRAVSLNGWRSRITNEGWKHFCPSCRKLYPFAGKGNPVAFPAEAAKPNNQDGGSNV